MFGKLPAQGDFVSRGLDQPLRDGLDQWLSEAMQSARDAFPDFAERYVQAPAWNYVDLDPQGQWSGGALCASVDRVGRLFPVIMGAPAADAQTAVGLSSACMSALHQAFEQGWDADQLYEAELVPAEQPWSPTGTEWALLGDDGPITVVGGRFPGNIVMTMVEVAL
ncbi:type VI secretion system-associated protein TagF [Novosphingobium album (ex Liu et al. 2023)]|uniref:Type VI secretion system-associated protein TagF n=1 Tax=Novosphingobium album (ex Liu et al. 2023) TaxID=3031130 RepID=A0ABT5WUZ9_9SPHN|nr:type VI secretion system-associated protein TagF [Novosphingobium album (ex Liu et al. 2023)]MDE8653712.1 type VI secretion system-associated protein TagF [Novosphingobium album (ex Liu et al. 2023)]